MGGLHHSWSWFWMAGAMVLFWGAAIALAVWFVGQHRGLSARASNNPVTDGLRGRLAAGEISPEDYEKTRRILEA